MSRNGAGLFTLDPRYLVSEGDTILPSQHNPVLEDLQTDANTPRPIVAGGTGASTATTARTNLSVYSIADVDDGFTPKVATRTALKALDTATTKAVVLTEASRQKLFMWMTGDFTDSVAGDPSELAYIPADGIDPALGCWVAVTGAGASIVPVIQGGTGANDAATALDNLGGMASATYDPNGVGGDVFDMANMVESTDAKIMTAAERADLAKATLNDDTDVSANSWVLDEDDMASDSATKVPTQQSVKAYADQFGEYSPTFNLTRVRSVQERLSEGVYLDDFLGSTDTDKLLDFAGSGEGYVRLPSKSMTVEESIVIDQDETPYVQIAGVGVEQSQIVFTGTGDLFRLTRSGNVSATGNQNGYDIRDMQLVATNDELATAIACDLDDASPSAGSYEGYNRRISRIKMSSQSALVGWATGIRLKNSSYAQLDDIFFRSVPYKGTGLYMTGAKASISNKINRFSVISANRGLYIDSHHEGTYVTQADMINTNFCVENTGPGPQFMVSKSHFNTQDTAINLSNVSSIFLSDILIYTQNVVGAKGVIINNDDDGYVGHVLTGVEVWGNSGSDGRGIQFTGLVNGATITGGGVSHFTGGRAIDIAAGCQGIYVDPSVLFQANNGNDFFSASETCFVQTLDKATGVMSRRVPEVRDYIAGTSSTARKTYKSRGTVDSPSVIQVDDVLHQDEILAWDGEKYASAGYLQWASDSTPGIGSMPGRFSVFLTNAGTQTPQERLRIRRNGAVITNPPPTNQGSLLSNGQVTWELTNDTTLTFRVKGNDGTVRSATITLA